MTDDDFDRVRELAHASTNGEIDVTQIDRTLSLTPTQRLEELEALLDALNAVWEGREAASLARFADDNLAQAHFAAARIVRQESKAQARHGTQS